MLLNPTYNISLSNIDARLFHVSIAPSTVSSNLADFPLMIDLSLMPSRFWFIVNEDGGNIRAYAEENGQEYALAISVFSRISQEGTIWVKVPLITVSTGANFILQIGDTSQVRAARNSTYGSRAVFADYAAVFLGGEKTDNYALTATTAVFPVNGDGVTFVNAGNPEMTFAEDPHQGATWHRESGEVYTSDNNVIRRYDSNGTLLMSNTDPSGQVETLLGMATLGHCCDLCVVDDWLIVPVNNYPTDTLCAIGVFNRITLELISATNVSATDPEMSGICWNPEIERLMSCRWGPMNSIRRWTLNRTTGAIAPDGSVSLTITGGTFNNQIQGIEYWRDHYWLSDDSRDEVVRVKTNGVCNYNDCPIQFSDNSAASVVGNYEGIFVYKDGLGVLIDPSSANAYFIYSKPANFSFGGGGARYGTNNGWFETTGLTGGTTWTMSISAARSAAKQQSLLTYRDFISGATNDRATIAHRFVTPDYSIQLWDNINSWLAPTTPVLAETNVWNRVAAIYAGTTRRLYIDGAERASQTGITARDAGFTALSIGIDDETASESFDGDTSFAYLRMGELSADWLSAEYLMLSQPNIFYTIT
jgi:hypothetical protein